LDETDWQKQLLFGVVMLVVVGGLIGVVVAVAGLKFADLAGIGSKHTSHSSSRPYIPRNVSSSGPSTATATQASPSSGSTATSPSTSAAPTKKPRRHAISLEASPSRVAAMGRINLSGRYAAPDGTRLQVQQQDNGVWSDFPVTVTVSGGQFATYVETGHTGRTRFRVTDSAHGRSSNTVAVTVG
jgi:hypothetical protein